jgi:hypothetical protein
LIVTPSFSGALGPSVIQAASADGPSSSGSASPSISSRLRPAMPCKSPYSPAVDSTTPRGRDLHFSGDTNTNYDTTGFIQVVVEGDFESEVPSAEQLSSLTGLLRELSITWKIPVSKISVHQQHASTDCPGRNLMTYLPAIIKQVASNRTSLR